MSSILVKNGRVIDPKSRFDRVADVLIEGNKIQKIDRNIKFENIKIIDASGMIISPGLIDLHCHLRDPGRPDEETIESGCRAAVAGGFTTICCMPNTEPPIDNEGIVNYILKEAERVNLCRVFPIATITKKREGKEIAEFGELVKAGAKGFSDDGNTVNDARVLRFAMEYLKIFDMPIFEHPLDEFLSKGGVMNESEVSTRLGLAGSPAVAEEVIVARDLMLAKFTGAKLHLCHISTKGSVELIKRAKKEGIDVTCETCPHYFFFNDTVLETYNTNYKVNPPIRSEIDRRAIIEGLRDGTIDCISTDHAPHTQAEKELEFASAPFGMIGLETALSMAIMQLVNIEKFSWLEILDKFSIKPAQVLKEKLGMIKEGATADIVIINPNVKWQVNAENIKSKSKNTPFLNKELTGRAEYVIVNGEIKYQAGI
ncbi:MAG: dihydroorotase [candidate division WOR-3 bacterium]